MTSSDPDNRDRRHRPQHSGLTHSHSRHTPRAHPDPPSGASGGTADAQPGPRPAAQLSGDAQRRLQAARLWIAANRPYYSKALFSCPVIAVAAPARVGIDEQWRIYASSQFLESVTVERAAAELIHVLNHALRDHARRARNTGVDAATATLWHVAADCEINDDLYEDNLIDEHDDDGWLLPELFDMDDLQPAEAYFRHLCDNAVPVEAPVAAPGGCGSGCHGQPVDHELPLDTAPLSDLDRKLLQRATALEVAARRKAHGTESVPDGLTRWAHQTLNPHVDWRQQLAAAVRASVHHTAGTADYTWQRPSRRQQPHEPVLRPAMTRPVPSITVVVDTSGSMSNHELDRALTEISAIIATVVCGDTVRVLSADTHIRCDQHIHNTNQINLQGGGGTNMATAISAAAETAPDAIVVITDGWTPWPPTRPPGTRCVIAALTEGSGIHWVPDWIQAIDITENRPT